jgi:hypothetical protein
VTDPACQLRPADKLVAIVLATYINRETGEAWPSVKTLCARTGYDRKTVLASLDRLCEGTSEEPRIGQRRSRSACQPVFKRDWGASKAKGHKTPTYSILGDPEAFVNARDLSRRRDTNTSAADDGSFKGIQRQGAAAATIAPAPQHAEVSHQRTGGVPSMDATGTTNGHEPVPPTEKTGTTEGTQSRVRVGDREGEERGRERGAERERVVVESGNTPRIEAPIAPDDEDRVFRELAAEAAAELRRLFAPHRPNGETKP